MNMHAGIADYLFFFLAVLGIYQIRRRDVGTEYRTWTLNPCVFCMVSGVIVLRGIVTDLVQGGAIAALVGIGWIVFRWRHRKETIAAVEVPMMSSGS
jgi:solute carrier family 7 (L-type amino acid transporter), member 6